MDECHVSVLAVLLSSMSSVMVLRKLKVILTFIFSFMGDNIAS